MKILTVVGARPQFIKAAVVSRALAQRNLRAQAVTIEEVLVHTGQHFDHNMSQAFFDELSIPTPSHHLDIHGGGHGEMTGRMLEALERTILAERPAWVLIYGDTNSTLAGALAAVKLHVPVAHVEAGLRSFNMRMPEEVNRIVADRVSSLLFCPTDAAVANLAQEGVVRGVHQVGDVMYDAALFYSELAARRPSSALARFGLASKSYTLATCHRAENTDDVGRLREILAGLAAVAQDSPVLLPIHPRTAKILERERLDVPHGIQLCEPLPFLDMIELEQSARLIATDSGGVQKEAYFYGVPCITMRDETEWVETVANRWNTLVGADRRRIAEAAERYRSELPDVRPPLYGDGHAGERIALVLSAASGS